MEAYEYIKKMLELKKKITVPRMEYVVIQELMDRLKVAEGKDKFLLQMKLNRAVRIARCREKFDPHNPINYGVIQNAQNQFASPEDDADKVKDGEDEGFDDMREKDTVLVAKLSELDKQLEQKLADLEHTFGKKGKLLEEEIKDLAEERNSLTEKKGQPLYRKVSTFTLLSASFLFRFYDIYLYKFNLYVIIYIHTGIINDSCSYLFDSVKTRAEKRLCF